MLFSFVGEIINYHHSLYGLGPLDLLYIKPVDSECVGSILTADL